MSRLDPLAGILLTMIEKCWNKLLEWSGLDED